jgi:hypothetical protein
MQDSSIPHPAETLMPPTQTVHDLPPSHATASPSQQLLVLSSFLLILVTAAEPELIVGSVAVEDIVVPATAVDRALDALRVDVTTKVAAVRREHHVMVSSHTARDGEGLTVIEGSY